MRGFVPQLAVDPKCQHTIMKSDVWSIKPTCDKSLWQIANGDGI
jgi:hypothetical protein